MLEKFEDSAADCILQAGLEATKLGHHALGTEHVLLGILEQQGESATRSLLCAVGVSSENVKDEIEKLHGKGMGFLKSRLPFTRMTELIFDLAEQEARQMEATQIAREHLLLAMLKEAGCPAHRILNSLVADPAKLRRTVLKSLAQQQSQSHRSEQQSQPHPAEEQLTHAHEPVSAEPVPAKPASADTVSAEPARKLNITNDLPNLALFGINLTSVAAAGLMDPFVGREEEMQRLFAILSRRHRANPLLVGEDGVGKTSLVEALATRIVEFEVPEAFLNKQVIKLDIGYLLTEREWKPALNKCLMEAIKGNAIVFMDEFHLLIHPKALGATRVLLWFLRNTDLSIIGALPKNMARQFANLRSALSRHFHPLHIHPPTSEETILIIQALRPNLEAHHKLSITPRALEQAVFLADEHIANRTQPLKAIDVLEEACTRVRRRAGDLAPVEPAIRQIRSQRHVEKRKTPPDQSILDSLAEQEESIKEQSKASSGSSALTVTEEDIEQVVSEWKRIVAYD